MKKSTHVHINPLGFREYDARWLYEKDISYIVYRVVTNINKRKPKKLKIHSSL